MSSKNVKSNKTIKIGNSTFPSEGVSKVLETLVSKFKGLEPNDKGWVFAPLLKKMTDRKNKSGIQLQIAYNVETEAVRFLITQGNGRYAKSIWMDDKQVQAMSEALCYLTGANKLDTDIIIVASSKLLKEELKALFILVPVNKEEEVFTL